MVNFKRLNTIGALSVIGCGAGAAQTPETAAMNAHAQHAGHAGHAGHGAHGGPLVHRFEHAEHWTGAFDDPARDAWQRPKEVVAAMDIRPGMTVADIGAGTGYFEPHLSRAVGDKGTVLALDVEPDMVRYMGERMKKEQLANVKPALVEFADPKLAPGSVDRILIVDTWHHIDARVAYASKLRASLKPGGKVFVVDYSLASKHGPPAEHRLAPEHVQRELTEAGLTTEVIAASLPEQYIVVGRVP